MKIISKIKYQKLSNKSQLKVDAKFTDLPAELLCKIANYLSLNKLKSFALVNKKCQDVYQHILKNRLKRCVDLRKCFYLKEKEMLERVKNANYESVNLRNCYQLSPRFITELISKESVRELDLLECDCTTEVIEAVSRLNLISLTLSLCNNENWFNFFLSNEKRSVPVFNGLKKLEMFHWNRPVLLMGIVGILVLPHCQRLQYLKLSSTCARTPDPTDVNPLPPIQAPELIPNPVPNLRTLILDFQVETNISPLVEIFLQIILCEKKLPLTIIYLGTQTVCALSDSILCESNLVFENPETLCLSDHRCIERRSFFEVFQLYKNVTNSTLKSAKYKAISLENLEIEDFSQFTEMLVKSGNTSIEKINLRGSIIQNTGNLCNFITEISNLCPQITFLDISILTRSKFGENDLELLNCLANLNNFSTLYMAPFMLSREVNKYENALKSSFLKVTKRCKLLKNLRVVDHDSRVSISGDVLLCIKFCKNLQELHLANFSTTGNQTVLPAILESCTKIKYLRVEFINDQTGFEEMLIHAKLIKHLYLRESFKMTKKFVKNLSRCTQLEKFYIYPRLNFNDIRMLKCLLRSLKKMNKLQMLGLFDGYLVREQLKPILKKFQASRPRFYFYPFDGHPPVAHHDFLKYPDFKDDADNHEDLNNS